MNGPVGLDALAGLSSLDDPVRQRLYEYVAEHDEPISREQAAAAVGIGRTLAAYHLDKLAQAGLLATRYQRPAGRSGPGAGRPAKLYRLAERELTVSVPPRDYELLARLLIESMERDPSGTVRAAINETALEAGRRASTEPGGDLVTALRGRGYQPRVDVHGNIELRNCPFHRLAQDHRKLVCGLNLSLVQGVIASTHERSHASLDPRPGRCCVTIQPG
jgi:predicted ArsR family transcriptional regulator